jgi:hypothetical protein
MVIKVQPLQIVVPGWFAGHRHRHAPPMVEKSVIITRMYPRR